VREVEGTSAVVVPSFGAGIDAGRREDLVEAWMVPRDLTLYFALGQSS
jgi:hypothetical protein